MSNNSKAAGRKKALKEFLIGVAVAAAGGIATAASYNAAASSRTGGTYTVYTGLIALGVVYAVKGLWGIVFPLGLRGDKKIDEASAPATVEKDEVKVVEETEE